MIRDTDGNPISTYIGYIEPSQVQTCTLQIDCEENTFLSCETTSAFVVEARKLGDLSWVNIETTRIPLTPYVPTRTSFEVRVTASASIEGRNRFSLRVGP